MLKGEIKQITKFVGALDPPVKGGPFDDFLKMLSRREMSPPLPPDDQPIEHVFLCRKALSMVQVSADKLGDLQQVDIGIPRLRQDA